MGRNYSVVIRLDKACINRREEAVDIFVAERGSEPASCGVT